MNVVLRTISILFQTGKPCIDIHFIRCDYDDYVGLTANLERATSSERDSNVDLNPSFEHGFPWAQAGDSVKFHEEDLSEKRALSSEICYAVPISKNEDVYVSKNFANEEKRRIRTSSLLSLIRPIVTLRWIC